LNEPGKGNHRGGPEVPRRNLAKSFVVLVSVVTGLASCSALFPSSEKKSVTLSQVDDLLSRVERVQVESVLGKERSRAAYESLRSICAPDFQGDPLAAHAKLSESIAQSQQQAAALGNALKPAKSAADSVFRQWMADLEQFGNTKMRKRSQARLEETRTRFDAIVSAANAAQLAYDAFNADLNDQALFLAHDFNAAAVAVIADDVAALDDDARELDGRLDACVVASKDYVETAALRGQLQQQQQQMQQEQAAAQPSATEEQPRRPMHRKAKPAPTTSETPAQGVGTEVAKPSGAKQGPR
jgi:hypothetical protein